MLTCPVCLDEITNNLFIPFCRHVFHNKCITRCLHRDIRCPICRRVIDGIAPKESVYIKKEFDGTRWTVCIDANGKVLSSLPLWI
jgi:hypothetical protein